MEGDRFIYYGIYFVKGSIEILTCKIINDVPFLLNINLRVLVLVIYQQNLKNL